MKKIKSDSYQFWGFACRVFSRDELKYQYTVEMEDTKVKEYAVFVRTSESQTYVQVSRWFHYRGAAINKMCRMYGI